MFQASPSQTNQAFEEEGLDRGGLKALASDLMVLEYVSEDQGGGVKLAKAHYDGLNQSPNKNFEWSGLIASMEQFNDSFFLGTRTYFHGQGW
ncbi:hypothetical protein NC651_024809 [Populus alba x Populus x berolinensis]|nr:hypothetical protein NC651_024809 [Populus alba x Populus x berolinensis]